MILKGLPSLNLIFSGPKGSSAEISVPIRKRIAWGYLKLTLLFIVVPFLQELQPLKHGIMFLGHPVDTFIFKLRLFFFIRTKYSKVHITRNESLIVVLTLGWAHEEFKPRHKTRLRPSLTYHTMIPWSPTWARGENLKKRSHIHHLHQLNFPSPC